MLNIVAIDGPAGSGKSTVAKLVAKKLSFTYIDTGAMYRALTLKAMRNSTNLEDENVLVDLAKCTTIDIVNDKSGNIKALLDNEDVTGLIRTPELTANVHYLARVKGVREEMVRSQQKMAQRSRCVFEGRDTTTVVFPKAEYRFYLDASITERAKRRHKELTERGENISLGELEEDIKIRDSKDKTRVVGPLRKASGVTCVDTTNMSIEEVVDKICSHIK